ncbi:hypothetical protein SAMN05660642_00652 [Geodermatophilus siccatus]|uniref:Uncharacterized protein n=1 Tax=Geodermatophilus siccatus TaxID=1137991 RepID=A0A1G9LZ45_9ACTN|nr:hypothetical protein [Geodermatophilus siccatus]SDL67300.1 hypothetical protein SAMN05660642_00652 [Geodermatophilus siccatus]
MTVTALGTVVALSTDAGPGDVLYGVKRGTERTQLVLAGDDGGVLSGDVPASDGGAPPTGSSADAPVPAPQPAPVPESPAVESPLPVPLPTPTVPVEPDAPLLDTPLPICIRPLVC